MFWTDNQKSADNTLMF